MRYLEQEVETIEMIFEDLSNSLDLINYFDDPEFHYMYSALFKKFKELSSKAVL